MKKLISISCFFLLLMNISFAQMPAKITPEEVDKGLEDLAANVGMQTYIFGLPAMITYKYVNVVNRIKVQNQDPNFKFRATGFENGIFYNQFVHVTTIPNHEVKTQGSPQDDAIYSWMTVNIKKEPLIITVPPIKDRYFSLAITDAYMENIDYVCSRLGHKNGGSWALVGPDWKGTLPKKVKMIRMPGYVFAFLNRIQVRDPEVDILKAREYQKAFKVESLSKFTGKIKEDTKELMEVPPNTEGALDWYNYILKIMKDNRPQAKDAAFVQSMKLIGLDLDKEIDVKKLSDPIKRGLERGFDMGKSAVKYYMVKGPDKAGNTNWNISYERGRPVHNYLFRAYYAGIGVWTHLREEAIYCPTILDSNGDRLNGSNEYEITLPKDKLNPATGFWSLITYEASDFVPNKYFHYSVGFDKKDPLKKNPDGSVTIHVSNDPPNGEVSNWLPTPKGTDFRIIYRMYNPIPEVLTMEGLQTYLPPVRKIAKK